MAKLNVSGSYSPTFVSDSGSDKGSFLFSFFSSSSSFISPSSLSDELWSETSFSFSSDDAAQQKEDKTFDQTQTSAINDSNNEVTERHFKFDASSEPNSGDDVRFKLSDTENNLLRSQLEQSRQKNFFELQKTEPPASRGLLNFCISEISNSYSDAISCDICGKGFDSQATLDVHKLNHLVSETYVCEVCNHISKHREDYILHFRIHTRNDLDGSSTKRKIIPYRCDTCGKTFRFESSFKRHLEKHTLSHICNICKAAFPTQLLCHQHKLQHVKKKVHKCEECGKIFQRPHQLTIHMQVHKNDKKYHCQECDTTYCYKTSLMRHALKYHSPDSQKFQCDVCGELFKNKKMLNGHVILHTAKKLIQCPDCSQTFKYRSSYHRHRIIHQGLKPFRCSACGKLFKTLSHLKTHKAQHVVNDEFVCSICDKSFGFQSFLDQHMLMHDNDGKKDDSTYQSD